MFRKLDKIMTAVVVMVLGTTIIVSPGLVAAAPTVLITELQTGSIDDSGAELVRVFNLAEASIDVTGWKIQYQSAAGTSWTTKATLQGSIVSGTGLLLTSAGVTDLVADQSLSDGMAATGGHIRLIDKSGLQIDLVGWGSATHPETLAAPAPEKSQSLLRRHQANVYIDTNNNSADFELEVMPHTEVPPLTPSLPEPSPADAVLNLLPPVITELLPNPASPGTDANDEFIEIFNPNNVELSLKDYKFQTGSNFSGSVSLSSFSVPPESYAVFTSGQTSLSLSNTSGAARVLSAEGTVFNETSPYGKAAEGQAYALIDGTWQWTASPTPGAPNNLTAPPATGSASSKSATKNTKATTAAKPTNANTAAAGNKDSEITNQPQKLHSIILAVVGAGALAYAVYEYRQDIKNSFIKLRRYRENRRGDRAAAEGRRGD